MSYSAVKKQQYKSVTRSSGTAGREARRREICARSTNLTTSAYDADSVRIYTDGACSSNGRAGAVAGWGVHFPDGELPDICGPLVGPVQTNQRAELTALMQALSGAQQLAANVKVNIYTDSEYSINCVTKWIANWKKNGWTNAKRKPVLNSDLIREVDSLMHGGFLSGRVRLHHVRGHVNDPLNDKADSLARQGALMRQGN